MISELVQRTKEFLFSRRTAYCRVFSVENRDAQLVLADLAKFCRAHVSTVGVSRDGQVDPLLSARLDGRREVWLRLQQHIHLDDETLYLLYAGPNTKG